MFAIKAPVYTSTQLRPITVKEYYQMVEVGILQADENLELINGQIIKKMAPQGSYHAAAISRTNRILFGRFFANAFSAPPITHYFD